MHSDYARSTRQENLYVKADPKGIEQIMLDYAVLLNTPGYEERGHYGVYNNMWNSSLEKAHQLGWIRDRETVA